MKGSFYFALFFLLLGVFGIIESLTFGYWESTALPQAMSSIIFLMAAIEVGRELRGRGADQRGGEEKAEAQVQARAEALRFSTALGWIVGFALASYLFGFLISIPVFTLAYFKQRGRSWLKATIFTVILLAIMYGGFELGFKVELYRGLIFGG